MAKKSASFALGINFAFLIESIEKPIEELTISNSMIETTYKLLSDRFNSIIAYNAQLEK